MNAPTLSIAPFPARQRNDSGGSPQSEGEVEKAAPDVFQSNEEPRRGREPLRIGLIEGKRKDSFVNE